MFFHLKLGTRRKSRILPKINAHRIHVWYIYLHDWVIYEVNVGKYSIHGSYGMCKKTIQLHSLYFKGLSKALCLVTASRTEDLKLWHLHDTNCCPERS